MKKKPEMYEVNGYDVIQGEDFKWRVWDSDGPVGAPHELLTEAIRAAESLPPKGGRR